MKVIEDWIDRKLTSLVARDDGYIILTDEDVSELAQALGLSQKPVNTFMEEAIKDYVYYLTDMHKDCFQEKLEAFGKEYEEQEKMTFNVESELCQ